MFNPDEGTSFACLFTLQVLQKSTIHSSHKRFIKFFHVATLDTFFAGSTVTSHGAIIGLPVNFTYKSSNDVDTRHLAIRNTTQPLWSSREGKQLKESLVLSENAQKFAIAREIYWADNYYVLLNSVALSIAVGNTYMLSHILNNRFQLVHRIPRKLRLVVYALVAAFNGTVYICLKDGSAQYFDRCADNKAAEMGPDYLEGGVEFYRKTLQKNIALRALMGAAGERTYTSKGNINRIFRTDHLPLTHRLDTLMSQLKAAHSQPIAENIEMA